LIDLVTINIILESIGNLKILIIKVRIKLAIKNIRNKKYLFISRKSFIEIIFVFFFKILELIRQEIRKKYKYSDKDIASLYKYL
jgi:hypothetical protein